MAHSLGHELEVLVFDAESGQTVQKILQEYKSDIDFLEVKKDQGQYDAINKGIQRVSGEYWTWLNTDDLLDAEGFMEVLKHLSADPSIDYIYGNIQYIDAENRSIKTVKAWPLTLEELRGSAASVFQPGSWFRKASTDQLGLLKAYRCCFDYEYICRLLKSGARVRFVDRVLAKFRYYPASKSGSIMQIFVAEQWEISKAYGRKWYEPLTWMLALRRIKHSLLSKT